MARGLVYAFSLALWLGAPIAMAVERLVDLDSIEHVHHTTVEGVAYFQIKGRHEERTYIIRGRADGPLAEECIEHASMLNLARRTPLAPPLLRIQADGQWSKVPDSEEAGGYLNEATITYCTLQENVN